MFTCVSECFGYQDTSDYFELFVSLVQTSPGTQVDLRFVYHGPWPMAHGQVEPSGESQEGGGLESGSNESSVVT